MAIRQFAPGGAWHYYYKRDGKVRSVSLGTADRRQAEAIAATIAAANRAERQRAKMNEALGAATAPARDDVRPASAATRPAQRITATPLADVPAIAGRHRKVAENSLWYWKRLVKDLPGVTVQQLTPQLVQEHLERIYGDKTPKTYNNALSYIRTILAAALVECGLKDNPAAPVMQRKVIQADVQHYRPFAPAEVDAILSRLDPYWRLLSVIAMTTGLRLESCRRLCPDMIAGGVITIMPGKTARFGRAVKIPVLPRLAEELAKLSPDTPDTPYCSCYPATRKAPGRDELAFGAVLEAAGVRANEDGAVGFHSWRVLYVTRLSEQGVDDRVIRGIVGHASQQMTDLYNHDTRSAIEQLRDVVI